MLAQHAFQHNNAGLSKRVDNTESVAEIFDLPGALLYSPADFKKEFGQEGWEQGHELKDWPTPMGSVTGYRIKDHGRRPLPTSVIPIRRQMKSEAAFNKVIDDGSDLVDGNQMRDAFVHQAQHRVFAYEDHEARITKGVGDDPEGGAIAGAADLDEVEVDPADMEDLECPVWGVSASSGRASSSSSKGGRGRKGGGGGAAARPSSSSTGGAPKRAPYPPVSPRGVLEAPSPPAKSASSGVCAGAFSPSFQAPSPPVGAGAGKRKAPDGVVATPPAKKGKSGKIDQIAGEVKSDWDRCHIMFEADNLNTAIDEHALTADLLKSMVVRWKKQKASLVAQKRVDDDAEVADTLLEATKLHDLLASRGAAEKCEDLNRCTFFVDRLTVVEGWGWELPESMRKSRGLASAHLAMDSGDVVKAMTVLTSWTTHSEQKEEMQLAFLKDGGSQSYPF